MNRWIEKAGRWLIVLVFGASLWMLYRELSHYDLQDVSRRILAIPSWRIGLAVGLMVLNYVVLIGYDYLALRAIEHPLPWQKVAFGSFTGFVTSYNLGPLLGGSAVRFRLYSSWGLSAVEILQLVGMLGITFWIGVLFLAGLVFTWLPDSALVTAPAPLATIRGLGCLLLLGTTAYIALTGWRRKPIRLGSSELRLPSASTTILQIVVAGIDFLIAAGCFYVLISHRIELSYWQTLAIMLMAMVTAVLSHVPGGVGIFELVVLGLAGEQEVPELMACLLAFRLVYFLLPLGLATLMLAANELAFSRAKVADWTREIARWSGAVAPRFLAAGIFLCGVVLLFSGATPMRSSRLPLVESLIPLPIVEISHFVGSVIGASLLVIALGLNRRLDSAWWLAILLTMCGIVASVLKGLDYEEAIFLASVAFVLVLYRKSFYRRGQLANQTLSRDCFGAIALVMLCAVWLAVFANKNVEYSSQLWWDFSFRGDASRVLRGSVGALCVLLLFAVRRLLIPHLPHRDRPDAQRVAQAAAIAQRSTESSSSLALLGDKQFMFNDEETGFVMYAVQGRSWIAMRDPVGPREALPELAWSFRALVDQHDGWPVFYQVNQENLTIYLDQGLTLIKLGEEARVPLVEFSMEGPVRRGLRQTYSRLQRERCTFEVVSPEQVVELLPELREISNAWLTSKEAHEKGFSLGFFDEDYVRNFPCAIVRRDDRIMGFSNLWCSAEKEEVACDLMRYRPDSPASLMEYLLIESILWSKEQGYHWFNLGMAPLSGIADRPLAPLWNRAVGLIFRHGDHLYSFEGLRKYKEKFSPVWTPKYLASPGGLALPKILADVAMLIARKPSILKRPSTRPERTTEAVTPSL